MGVRTNESTDGDVGAETNIIWYLKENLPGMLMKMHPVGMVASQLNTG